MTAYEMIIAQNVAIIMFISLAHYTLSLLFNGFIEIILGGTLKKSKVGSPVFNFSRTFVRYHFPLLFPTLYISTPE